MHPEVNDRLAIVTEVLGDLSEQPSQTPDMDVVCMGMCWNVLCWWIDLQASTCGVYLREIGANECGDSLRRLGL